MKADEMDGLIQDVLDGVATPQEVRRLDSAVTGDPVSRERYHELRDLFATLGTIPDEEPPPTLQAGVLRRLRSAQLQPRRREGFGARFLPRGAVLASLRPLALSFASGLGVGAIMVALLTDGFEQRPGVLRDGAVGSMLGDPAPAAGTPLEEKTLTLGEAHVEAAAFGSPGGIVLRLEARSEQETSLGVSFPVGGYRLVAVHHSGPGGARFETETGEVEIRHAGEGRYWIGLESVGRLGGPIGVSLASGQASVRETIRTGPAGTGP